MWCGLTKIDTERMYAQCLCKYNPIERRGHESNHPNGSRSTSAMIMRCSFLCRVSNATSWRKAESEQEEEGAERERRRRERAKEDRNRTHIHRSLCAESARISINLRMEKCEGERKNIYEAKGAERRVFICLMDY